LDRHEVFVEQLRYLDILKGARHSILKVALSNRVLNPKQVLDQVVGCRDAVLVNTVDLRVVALVVLGIVFNVDWECGMLGLLVRLMEL